MLRKSLSKYSLSSRDRAIFTFSEFEPRLRLGQSQMTFDNLSGYILSILICTCMQNISKYSKRFKSYRHFLRIGRRQNLHKQIGVKIFTSCPVTIKCLIIGHSMKFNFKFQLTFLGSCNFNKIIFKFIINTINLVLCVRFQKVQFWKYLPKKYQKYQNFCNLKIDILIFSKLGVEIFTKVLIKLSQSLTPVAKFRVFMQRFFEFIRITSNKNGVQFYLKQVCF